jgi:hypothetical protein
VRGEGAPDLEVKLGLFPARYLAVHTLYLRLEFLSIDQ